MSALFPYFKQVALDSGHADNVDLNSDTIKLLYLNGYTYDSTDRYVADVLAGPGVTEIARTGALDTPAVTNGTFDAANETTAGITAGSTITDVIIFAEGASDAASVVIGHIDKDNTNADLALLTDGSPITATFDAAGIFSL